MTGTRTIAAAAFFAVIAGWSPHTVAQDIAEGALAAAIRESGNPCQRVLESSSAGQNSYVVTCNSGKFKVTQKQDGSFDVSPM